MFHIDLISSFYARPNLTPGPPPLAAVNGGPVPLTPGDPDSPGGGGHETPGPMSAPVHLIADSVAPTVSATNIECLVPIPSNQLVSEIYTWHQC